MILQCCLWLGLLYFNRNILKKKQKKNKEFATQKLFIKAVSQMTSYLISSAPNRVYAMLRRSLYSALREEVLMYLGFSH